MFTYSSGDTSAYTDSVDVRPAAPALILSLADAKAHLNVTTSDNDAEIRSFLESVTEVVEQEVGPVVVRSYTQRVDSDGPTIVLDQAPAVSLTTATAVLDDGTDLVVGELTVDGPTGIVRRLDGADFSGGPWDFTYTAGRTSPPARFGHAARIILAHMWTTQRGAARPRGAATDDTPWLAFSVPRRALELLGRDVRPPGVA